MKRLSNDFWFDEQSTNLQLANNITAMRGRKNETGRQNAHGVILTTPLKNLKKKKSAKARPKSEPARHTRAQEIDEPGGERERERERQRNRETDKRD